MTGINSKQRILIVDDMSSNAILMKRMLEHMSVKLPAAVKRLCRNLGK